MSENTRRRAECETKKYFPTRAAALAAKDLRFPFVAQCSWCDGWHRLKGNPKTGDETAHISAEES